MIIMNSIKTIRILKTLFYSMEYFHGDTARGVGASHQTGWTGVVAELINRVASFEKEKIGKEKLSKTF